MAAELGPSDVRADRAHRELFRSVGFTIVEEEDATSPFQATCEAILRARVELEHELRTEEGDALFEEEQRKKRHMLEGIARGLLRRTLLVATKP